MPLSRRSGRGPRPSREGPRTWGGVGELNARSALGVCDLGQDSQQL